MELTIAARADATRCAVCHGALGWRPVSCPECDTRLHPGCLAELVRCPTLGCPCTRPLALSLDRPPRPSWRLRAARHLGVSPLVGAWLTVGAVLLCFASSLGFAAVLSPICDPEHSRAAAARADLMTIETAIKLFRLNTGRDPRSLSELWQRPPREPGWRGPYLDEAPCDPWGRPYRYVRADFELRSLGADGRPGGEAEDADISLRDAAFR